MTRPAAVGVVLLLSALVGVWAWYRPTPTPVTLDCAPGQQLTLGEDGVARCGPGAALPAGQAMTVKQKFDCNAASEDELALVPSIGRAVAHELVARRPDGGYREWGEVDAVAGVGVARLNALQEVCELRGWDGGV